MALTSTERARVRRAMGYLNVTDGSTLSFGSPIGSDFVFLIETRMDALIDPEGVELVRENLGRVEGTLSQLYEAQERLAAKRVDSIETNPTEIPDLRTALQFWSRQLAEVLGVPAAKYSFVGGASNSISVPVVG